MRIARSVVAAVVTLGVAVPAATTAAADRSANEITMAVIGDVPYGADQEATFGSLIDAVNDDPKVRTVVHVGDIKNGSTPCTDERFLAVRAAFDMFKDPVVYTPGDNEWTDCHRPAAGGYNPLERLATLRTMFFAEPGRTLGRRTDTVVAQPGYPENVRWTKSRVTFATLHVVGSDNGLAPWTGNLAPTPAQAAEVAARIAATVAWVDESFDEAERTGSDRRDADHAGRHVPTPAPVNRRSWTASPPGPLRSTDRSSSCRATPTRTSSTSRCRSTTSPASSCTVRPCRSSTSV